MTRDKRGSEQMVIAESNKVTVKPPKLPRSNITSPIQPHVTTLVSIFGRVILKKKKKK